MRGECIFRKNNIYDIKIYRNSCLKYLHTTVESDNSRGGYKVDTHFKTN